MTVTSPGQRADSVMFTEVLRVLRFPSSGPGRPRTRPGRILADKAYSSRAIRVELRWRHIIAVIPERRDQRANRARKGSAGGRPPAFDAAAYRDRNTAESCFNKLKQHRAVATRYDKRDYTHQGTRPWPASAPDCTTSPQDHQTLPSSWPCSSRKGRSPSAFSAAAITADSSRTLPLG
ncbi:transposase [Saccharopolyspora lacisalsi]|uniref:Transposase n=1 Tax=Halosaccharopolyspora lacisalsi TaxID=1000566 RepID=A0A839DX80_9PSEU|nr:transposase [Halosaccharopolyspora lacisalsi]